MDSVATQIQLPELDYLYQATGTRVSRRTESAAAVTNRSSIPDENPGKLFISFKIVKVNDHEGISEAHIFLFMCFS